MNIVLDISTASSCSLCLYLFPYELYQFFEKHLGNNEKSCSCLVSVALFPPCAIILENKSRALGIKS